MTSHPSVGLRRLASVAAAYAVSDGLIRGLSFVTLPMLVSRLSSSEFGVFGVLAAVTTLLTHVFGFGLSSAPIRFHHHITDSLERKDFLGSLLVASAGSALVGTAALHALAPVVARAFGYGTTTTDLLRISLWTGWFYVVARTLPLGVLRANEQAGRYLALSVTTVSATVVLVYWRLVVRDEGLYGAMRGTLEGAILTAVSALALTRNAFRIRFIWRHVAEGARFGLPLAPHHVSHWALGLSDRLLVGGLLGASALGIYHFAYQFASIFQMGISALNGAILPRFAALKNPEDHVAVDSLRHLVTIYLAVIVVAGAGIAITVPRLLPLVVSAEYAEAATFVPWLVFGVGFFGLYSVSISFLSMTLGRTGRIARVTIAAALTSVAINLFLLRPLGLWAAVLATAASYALLWLGVERLARLESPLMRQLLDAHKLSAVIGFCGSLSALSALVSTSTLAGSVTFSLAMLLILGTGAYTVVRRG